MMRKHACMHAPKHMYAKLEHQQSFQHMYVYTMKESRCESTILQPHNSFKQQNVHSKPQDLCVGLWQRQHAVQPKP